jgi:3-hydroxyacyl-[acyl-carrier-protein] dehydratase
MQYIPQAPPFVMIDELVTANSAGTITTFTVKDQHLFVEHGYFTEPGIIENMAQTAAAGTGKIAADQGIAPPVGFIGAIKGLQIIKLPAVGQKIETEVQPVTQVMNASIVNATVRCEGQVIAAAEFKIFLQ